MKVLIEAGRSNILQPYVPYSAGIPSKQRHAKPILRSLAPPEECKNQACTWQRKTQDHSLLVSLHSPVNLLVLLQEHESEDRMWAQPNKARYPAFEHPHEALLRRDSRH